MADYRFVHTHMWRSDEWYAGLGAEGKLLWVYLFTNPSASVAGVYHLPARVISFETGMDKPTVTRLMAEFQQAGKIMWDGDVVWVCKMRSYQSQGNPNSIAKCIERDLARIPDGPIKAAYQAYQSGTRVVPECPHTDTTDCTIPIPIPIPIPTPILTPIPSEAETTAAAAPELDLAFGAVWTVYTSENLVNPISPVQQEDVADMAKLCRDPAIHREAIKRARRSSNRPSLGLVFKIVNDFVETGSWEKPGGNGHSPPGKADSIGDTAILATLEAMNGSGKTKRTTGAHTGGP